MKVFIDTWGWLALGDRKEKRHQEIKAWYSTIHLNAGMIYTSDYVLDETFTLLFRRLDYKKAIHSLESIQDSVNKNFIKIIWMNPSRFEKAKELRRKFSDKPLISFTDLTSMAIMSEFEINNILTEDNHFLQVGLGFKRIPEN